MKNKKVEYLINNIILFVKFYIHKCRFTKSLPNVNALKNDFSLFCKSLKKIDTVPAINFFSLISEYQLI